VTESENVHISHNVTNFEFLYEPFYVASDSVPPHDERFLGYGYTRNTQVRAFNSQVPLYTKQQKLIKIFVRIHKLLTIAIKLFEQKNIRH
jgi:Glycosyl-transferase for dystroglycan